MPSFNDFLLQPATRALLTNMEITEPTPVQVEAIPALLAGKDLVGQSPTGSGKTLAYGIPMVERLSKDKRVVQALILVPTRELAVQVNTVLSRLATNRKLSTALLVGGRPYGSQLSALRYGSQIVVGTPGRVKDHLDRGSLVLTQLRMCVLDEADQMLDSGFAPAIEEILTTTPDTRQMALFSATIPEWITTLQKKFLKNPVIVNITPATGEQSTIEQIAYQVPQEKKMAALCTLLHATEGESSLIFGRTKYGVEKLGKQLNDLGFTVGTLHGNKSQRAREEVLTAFRRGQVQTLLATNVAARGLDIQGIYQVINYELPESSDLFTHRIGRTGRMGRQGKAITLLVPSDVPKWRRMAHNLGQTVSLQRLTIDPEAIVTMPLTKPVASVIPEHAQYGEQQPGRGRNQSSQDQERARFVLPKHGSQRTSGTESTAGMPRNPRHLTKHDSQRASGTERRQNDSATYRTPARPVESFTLPARPFPSQRRDDRRVAGKQFGFGRTTDKRRAHTFAATAPQRPIARRKPGTATSAQARHASAANRFASR